VVRKLTQKQKWKFEVTNIPPKKVEIPNDERHMKEFAKQMRELRAFNRLVKEQKYRRR